jgi:hypothetical protein
MRRILDHAAAFITAAVVVVGCTAINSFDDVVVRQAPPPVCEAEPCKLTAPQCGCPADQMCEYVSGAVECVLTGTAQLGEECMAYGCAPGLHCVQIHGPPASCRPWCDDDSDCPDGGACMIGLDDGNGGIFGQRLCAVRCDPLTNEGCTLAGTKCSVLLSESLGQWYTSCVAAGDGDEGAFCTDTGDCLPGFHCVNASMFNSCRPYCEAAVPQCAMGQSCHNFEPSSVIDGVIYGVCLQD